MGNCGISIIDHSCSNNFGIILGGSIIKWICIVIILIPQIVEIMFILFLFLSYYKDNNDDDRYQDQLNDDIFRRVKSNLSKNLAINDQRFSKNIMEDAHEKAPFQSAPVANVTMENIERVFSYFLQGPLTPAQEQEIELYAGGALNMIELNLMFSMILVEIDGVWYLLLDTNVLPRTSLI